MPEESSPQPWQDLLEDIVRNVRKNVRELLPRRDRTPRNTFKGLLDRTAQDAITEVLRGRRLSATLISEEGDESFGSGEYVLVADPVDGTTNLARGLRPSVVSVSAASSPTQSSVFAAVVAGIETDELFFAQREKGAFLNGAAIHTAEPAGLSRAVLSLDISKIANLSSLAPVLAKARHVRSLGCAAMSLCRVAQGVMDVHMDPRGLIRATDVSAGLFILHQAGGVYVVNGGTHGDFPLRRDTRISLTAASNPGILEEIRSLLNT